MESSQTAGKLFLLLFIIISTRFSTFAQSTFYSQGSDLFTNASNWNTSPGGAGSSPIFPADYTSGTQTFIVQNGHTITVNQDITIAALTIGGGTSGKVTIGNDATPRNVAINGALTIQAGATLDTRDEDAIHLLFVGSDLTNQGILDLYRSTTRAADLTLGGSGVTVIAGSGTAFQFNNLITNGGGTKLLTSNLDIEGNFEITGNTSVTTSDFHNCAGNFTITSGAYTADDGRITFDGSLAQIISTNNTATFDQVFFDNGGSAEVKTIVGDYIANDLTRVYDDAFVVSADQLSLQNFNIYNADPAALNFTGTISFTGGTIYFADGNTNGAIKLGTANILIEGTAYIQAGDQVITDGDFTITSGSGSFVISDNATLTGTGIFTIEQTRNLYIRGTNNFPTGFSSYVFETDSWVRYDADLDQTVQSGVNYYNLLLNQAGASPVRNKTTTGSLQIANRLDLRDGVKLVITGTDTTRVGGNIYTNNENCEILATNEVLKLNGTDNDQTIDAGTYSFNSLVVDNKSLTAVRTIHIDGDFTLSQNLTVNNTGGTEATYLIFDVDDKEFLKSSTSGTFTLGAYVRYYTSGTTQFANTLGRFSTVSMDAESYVRFDGTNQTIAGGITYGNIDLWGNGNKTIAGNINILNDIMDSGYTPVLTNGSFQITIGGDWLLESSNTTNVAGIVVFNGVNQVINGSNFGTVQFKGSGIKTINGALDLKGYLSISNGVTVNASIYSINLEGNWVNTGSGIFIQTTGTTTFEGSSSAVQNVIVNSNNHFGNLTINRPGTNKTLFVLGAVLNVDGNFDFAQNNATLQLNASTLNVGKNFYFRQGCSYDQTGTIVFNGNTEQNIYNYNSITFNNLSFSGTGEKYLREQDYDVNGNFTIIDAITTVDANGRNINVAGNWTQNGSFQHYARVTFDGANKTQTISASNFHDLYIANTGTGSVVLAGNITLTGNLQIEPGATFDVSVTNYKITVEENWTNNGTFIPRNGMVTFTGGNANIYIGAGGTNRFYNLVTNLNSNNTLRQREAVIIENDLTILNGIFQTDPYNLNIAGSLLNSSTFNHNNNSSILTFDGSSGTHTINAGTSSFRNTVINASGAVYNLTSDLTFLNNNTLTINAGTLSLQGKSLTTTGSSGTLTLNGGTLDVNAGAVLKLGASSKFTNTGGTFSLVGEEGNPATMTVNGSNSYYEYEQSGGTIKAQYFIIANTRNDGIKITGGAIDATNNFSNGTFTTGAGTAYLTVTTNFSNFVASNVVFNSGPTYNVSRLSGTGSIEFQIAGGTFAGEDYDNDPNNRVDWTFPAGLSWTGAVNTDWHNIVNWSSGQVPTINDIVYIMASSSFNNVAVMNGNAVAARITIIGARSLTLLGTNTLTIAENLTVYPTAALTQTNPDNIISIGGNWSNAGTFNENNSTVVFNGTEGSYTITTLGTNDAFYNLTINAATGVQYTLGNATTVGNNVTVSGGILSASSGFTLQVRGDWAVNGGLFSPGAAKVIFDKSGNSTQNIIGGTFYNVDFTNNTNSTTATKEIVSNISIANDLLIDNTGGTARNVILDGNENLIFIGRNWNNEFGPSGFTQTGAGTVIFNGNGQNIGNASTALPTTFNHINFQGTGTKSIQKNITVNGDLSIISSNNVVDINNGVSVTGTATGTMTMTGGTLRVFGAAPTNFPASFGTYSLTGGTVQYRSDANQNIFATNYYNLILLRNTSGNIQTKTLAGDITVEGNITVNDTETLLDVAGHTITLSGNLSYPSAHPSQINWEATGTLIHLGGSWSIDSDLTNFNHLVLLGSGTYKRLNNNLAITGDVSVGEDVILEMRDFQMVSDNAGSFTLGNNSILTTQIPATAGVAFPENFNSYSISTSSRVTLNDGEDQKILGGSGIQYGLLQVYTNGNATLTGDLYVNGNFDTNDNATLVDNEGATIYNLYFAGANTDIRNYTPSATSTMTFNGADQIIRNDKAANPDFTAQNILFTGTGTKTFYDQLDVYGNLTISNGVTLATTRNIDFSGSTWINNGIFSHTANIVTFEGASAQTIDPGTDNAFYAVTFNNTAGTTIVTNGMNIENGDFGIGNNAIVDMGMLTHTIASSNFNISAVGPPTWITSNTNFIFDRNGTQIVPALTAQDIIITNGGTVRLAGNWSIDDLTIESANIDVDIDQNYTINLTGNWNNNNGNFIYRQGTVAFESNNTTTKTISPGTSGFHNVTFNQAQTSTRLYVLQASTVFREDLTIGQGATLSLNSKTLTLGNDDSGNPEGETHTIQNGGELVVNNGSVLEFDCSDNGNNAGLTSRLTVQSGGTFSVIGINGDIATVTRSGGGNRVDINIEAGGTIGARYYHFQYLTDEGLDIQPGAFVGAVNGTYLSDGTWSDISTSNGTVKKYVQLNTDASGDFTIRNVTFNFNGSPNATYHKNVSRDPAGSLGLTRIITFENKINGLLSGVTYEEDGGTVGDGLIVWPALAFTTWEGDVSTDWFNASNWSGEVPTASLDAIVSQGQPYICIIDNNASSAICNNLEVTTGVLKIQGGEDITVNANVSIGSGNSTSVLAINDPTSQMNVTGGWNVSGQGKFVNGNATVNFTAGSGTVSLIPGTDPFYHIDFIGNGTFIITGNSVDVNGDFLISNSGTVSMASNNYNLNIGGDFLNSTTGTFTSDFTGTVILDGADQIIRNLTLYNLTVAGTNIKTVEQNLSIVNNLDINNGSTLKAQDTGDLGIIDMNGNVTIMDGGMLHDGGQTHTFSGVYWTGTLNSYTGSGTIAFDRSGGTQVLRGTGSNAAEFNHINFANTSQIRLDGPVNVTGNVTISSTTNSFLCQTYLLQCTTSTGSFSAGSGENIYVSGTDNFPAGFATYALDPNSNTRYNAAFDQTIRGVSYGNLILYNATVKTLSGSTDINGTLTFNNATLDVSTSNYEIEIAGHWSNNSTGSFLARSGKVTFDGATLQAIQTGVSGTKSFYDLTVNKMADMVRVDSRDITSANNLKVITGSFSANGHTVTVGGNMTATGGTFERSGTFYLNTNNSSASIRTNGSTLYNLTLNAPGTIYSLEDNLIADGDVTITQGTILDGAGKMVTLGDYTDNVSIAGTYKVGAGGILQLGNNTNLSVSTSGTIEIVGTSGNVATVTRRNGGTYNFTVDGTIRARDYLIEYMSSNGIFITSNGQIDATNNFSSGTFTNGVSGGHMLQIENTQDLTGANRIENVNFPVNPFGGASNVFKNSATSGTLEFYNATGVFAGESFDQDDNNLINWSYPPILTWTGKFSTDWYNANNWRTNGGTIPPVPPTANEDVIIDANEPNVVNYPGIVTPGATTKNLTIKNGAILSINSTAGTDLAIGGDLTIQDASSFIMSSVNDKITVTGSWDKSSAVALFKPGNGTVIFNAPTGAVTINNNKSKFNNLEIVVGSKAQLSSAITVTSNFTVTSGNFDMGIYDLTVGGNFDNNGTITYGTSGTRKVTLNPTTGNITLDPGSSSFYNLDIMASSYKVNLQNSNLTVEEDLNLNSGTLDLNGNTFNFGRGNGTESATIAGTLEVDANARLRMGNNSNVVVSSTGTFRLLGTDEANIATVTRQTTGAYTFQVNGTIEANYYLFAYMKSAGIQINSGATIGTSTHTVNNFSNGTFSNGATGGRYLWINTNPAAAFSISNITFNGGPTYNIKYDKVDIADIITIEDASGPLGGYEYEDDEEATPSATTGSLQWDFSHPTITWEGDIDDNWHNPGNWDINDIPDNNTRVMIGAGSPNNVILSAGNGDAYTVTVTSSGSFTISNNVDLSVASSLVNAGILTLNDDNTLSVGDLWTNSGAFQAGNNSTVVLTAGSGTKNITTGGDPFCGLQINSSTGNGVFQTADDMDVDCNFEVVSGTFRIADSDHRMTLAGNCTIQAGGTFDPQAATVTFDGTSGTQTLGNNGTTNAFYNLNFENSATKTLASNITVNNNLIIQTGSNLSGANYTLSLKGDWTNLGTFNRGTSTLAFTGSRTQIITKTGGENFYNFTVNNTFSPSLQNILLNDPLTIYGALSLIDGIIETSGTDIINMTNTSSVATAITTASYVNGPMRKVGNTDFIFPIGINNILSPIGIAGFASNSSTFRAQYYDQKNPNVGGNKESGIFGVTSLEYWDLSREVGSGEPLVSLHWTDGARRGIEDILDLLVCHWNQTSAIWENKGLNVFELIGNPTSGSITSNNRLTSFSPVTFGSATGANPLPVQFISFEAKLVENIVEIKWKTGGENNNNYFTIEKSQDGISFEEFKRVKGAGNSNSVNNYAATDYNPNIGVTYYRIKQTDMDGKSGYSSIVIVKFYQQQQVIMEIFPNPANEEKVNLQMVGLGAKEKVVLQIYDNASRLIYKNVIALNANGVIAEVINLPARIAPGIYIVTVTTSQGKFSKRLQKH